MSNETRNGRWGTRAQCAVQSPVVGLTLQLSDRIRIARQFGNMQPATLARLVGVTPSAASQWEHPTGTRPRIERLARVAHLTGVAFEWLTTGRGPMTVTGEASALSSDDFAQDADEERMLALWRAAPKRMRSSLLCLLSSAIRANAMAREKRSTTERRRRPAEISSAAKSKAPLIVDRAQEQQVA